MTRRIALGWAAFLAVGLALWLALAVAPTDWRMGHVQRMFYFHVAAAWNAFLAFGVVFAASLAYLFRGGRAWDRLAHASAELGLAFIAISLITGPLWAVKVWGTWWTWDPLPTTTLVLFFLYVAYLLLKDAAEGDERRARFAALFGVFAFFDVPLVYVSSRWWRSLHPVVFKGGGVELEGGMLVALIVSVLAFTVLYIYLLDLRYGIARAEDEVAALQAAEAGRA